MSMDAKVISPGDPPRADHRLIRYLLESTGSKVMHFPQEYAKIAELFQEAGGSWERAFKGSVSDISLLKKILKAAIKRGVMTKVPKW